MPAENVDALLLSARFDPSGLEAIPGAVNQALRDAQQGIPELEFIDAAELRAQLAQSGADVSGFFSGVRAELTETVTDTQTLNQALAAVDALELTFGGGDAGAILASAAAAEKLAAEASEASTATDDLNASSLALANNLGNLSGTLGRAAGQASALAAGFEAASNQRSVSNLAAISGTMGQAARQTSSWATGLAVLATQQNAAAANTEKLNAAAATSNRSVSLLRGGLVTLAAQSLGTSSALSQLAQSALFFAGGSVGVIAVAGAVLALSKAYELLTEKAREAKKAQDDAVESALARIAADITPEAKEANDRGALRRELATLANEELRLQEAIAAAGNDNAKIVAFTVGLQKNLAEQKRLTAALSLDEARAEADIAREAQSASNALIGGLGQQLAALQLGERAAQRMAVANQAHTESEREAALAIFDQITALKAAAKARDEAARAAEEAARAQAEITARFNAFWDDIEAKANLAGPLVVRRLKEIQAAQEKAAGDSLTAGIGAAFERAAEAASQLRTPADDAADAVERIAGRLTDVGTAAFALADVGSALGLIGDEAARALEDVGRLSDALASVATNASFGNIVGVVSAGINLLGGLFGGGGPSDESLALDVIRDNSEQLIALRDSLDRSLDTTQGLTAALGESSILQGIAGDLAPGDRLSAAQAQDFRDELARSGQTVESWADRIQALTGIDILDEKGHVVAATLGQVDDAILQLIADATSFGNSLDEQTRKADILAGLSGADQDPAAAFERQLDVIRKFSPAIDQAFQGVDPADKDAVRNAALELFDQFNSGFFTAHPELLGDLSKDDFLSFLEDSADFLDTFGQSVDDATKSLTNIPDTFKLAGAEFAARAVDSAPATPFSGPLANSQSGTTGTVITGGTFNFQVVAQPGMSPGDIARRVKQEFEAEAQADFGLRGAP